MTVPSQLLLDYQIEWMQDDSRVRIWEKSRRIGASWVCAAESVLDAAAEKGCDVFYVGFNREMTEEFISDCSSWATAIGAASSGVEETVIEDEANDILTYRIRFASGFRITALSSRPTGLRGKQGRVIIDEAAFHDDLAGLMKSAMAILMWGGRVDVLSTHNGIDSEFNRIIENSRAGRNKYSLHKTPFDEALKAGLYQRICMVLGTQWTKELERQWREELLNDYGDDADEELHCIPRRSGGTYLDRILLEKRMLPGQVLRFEAPPGFAAESDKHRQGFMQTWLDSMVAPALSRLPKGLMHSIGEDFGRTADLTVLAPCTINQNLTRSMTMVVELRDTPYREQEQAFNFVADRLPRFVYGALDATGNGQYLAERAWQRYGESRIECITMTDKWYAENLPPFKAAFEDKELTVVKDADVLTDLLSFQTIDGVPKLPAIRKTQIAKPGKSNKKKKRHGDAGLAMVLSHYASRQPIAQTDGYMSGSKRKQSETITSAGGRFGSQSGGIL